MERPILKPVGTPVEELDTPALVVDMDVLEANIRHVHSSFRDSSARLRPYVETHRCPAIAHRQIAAGGTVGGIAVAGVAEAELFVQNGISDVLVVNEVVSASKIARLCALAKQVSVTAAVDNPVNVRSLSEAAQASGIALNVLVHLNTGQEGSGRSAWRPGAGTRSSSRPQRCAQFRRADVSRRRRPNDRRRLITRSVARSDSTDA